MKNETREIRSVLRPSSRHALAAVATILLTSIEVVHGFVRPVYVQKRLGSRASKTSLLDSAETDTEEDSLASSSSLIWNWNTANSSLGSLLLRLQKEEEEEMKRAVGHTNSTTTSNQAPHHRAPPPPPHSELSPMDLEAARELDDAVTKRSKDDLLNGIQVLPTSSLYSTLTKKKRLPKGAECFAHQTVSSHYEGRRI